MYYSSICALSENKKNKKKINKNNIYNGIFFDMYLKWKWYCEKWVITTLILLRSHQAIQIFISKRIP